MILRFFLLIIPSMWATLERIESETWCYLRGIVNLVDLIHALNIVDARYYCVYEAQTIPFYNPWHRFSTEYITIESFLFPPFGEKNDMRVDRSDQLVQLLLYVNVSPSFWSCLSSCLSEDESLIHPRLRDEGWKWRQFQSKCSPLSIKYF